MDAEAHFEEGVLPLGVEEGQALDVDQQRLIGVVEEHVVRAELPVHQGVPGPRLDGGRERGEPIVDVGDDGGDRGHPAGGLSQVTPRRLKNHVPACPAGSVRPHDLAEPRITHLGHPLQPLAAPRSLPCAAVGKPAVQCAPVHVLDHGQVSGQQFVTGVRPQQSRSTDVERRQFPIGRGVEV